MKERRKTIAIALAIALPLLAGCESAGTRAQSAVVPETASAVPGALATDALLATRLAAGLKNDPLTQDAEIHVSVSQGRARLSGFVDTAAEKLRAGALALETDGVETIDNRLILRHRAELLQSPIGDARVRL